LKALATLFGLLLLAGASGVVWADTVKVPLGQQRAAGEDVPRLGMKKAQVENQYGNPERRKAPVGEPPISSWEYPDYVVYFEGDTVLHTVHKPERRQSEASR